MDHDAALLDFLSDDLDLVCWYPARAPSLDDVARYEEIAIRMAERQGKAMARTANTVRPGSRS